MTRPFGFSWPNGERCAVSLTYDDGMPVHHREVAPLLAKGGLKATFYLCALPRVTESIENWKDVAALGHELGNHTLFHPCRREPRGRFHWLAPHYDLCDYTPQRWMDEMRIANCLLRMIDGRAVRTFGNTCSNTTIGRGRNEKELDQLILRMFAAGRGPSNGEIVTPARLNYGALGCFQADGKTFSALRKDIERAAECAGWIILMFHGVGKGTHASYIEIGEHASLVDYLVENSGTIWTSSVVDVVKYLKGEESARSRRDDASS